MFKEFVNVLHDSADGLIEIREIDGRGSVPRFYKLEELSSYALPAEKNVFMSIYTRSRKQGTKQASKTTGVIWADYDYMNLEEVEKCIKGAQLPEPSIYVNSGNGIHAYWKLNKRYGHEVAQIAKSIAEATGADTKVAEPARIMRIPGSNNVKDLNNPKSCSILKSTGNVYSLEAFAAYTEKPQKAPVTVIDLGVIVSKPCIKNMLLGVSKGHRNFALGRITKYLQQQGYTQEKALEVVKQFNANCTPSKSEKEVIVDFNAYWEVDYKLLGCKITDVKLQSILSEYCNRETCSTGNTIDLLTIDNSVALNNRIVFKDYKSIPINKSTPVNKSITGHELLVFGLLLMFSEGLSRAQVLDKLYSKTKQSLVMTDRTLDQAIEKLEEYKLIEVHRQKAERNKKVYFAKVIDQANYGMGFTLVSHGAILLTIDQRITPGQLKLYAMLLKYAYGKKVCYPSTLTLAKELKVTQQAVHKMLKELVSASFIQPNISYPKGVKHVEYRLLI